VSECDVYDTKSFLFLFAFRGNVAQPTRENNKKRKTKEQKKEKGTKL
jgi:hypothetical protein